MSDIIDANEIPQVDSDAIIAKIREAIALFMPFAVNATDEAKKRMLKPSALELGVIRDINPFIANHPGSITGDFPTTIFNSCTNNTHRIKNMMDVLLEFVELLDTFRMVCNHDKKIVLLVMKKMLDIGVELGHSEYNPMKERIDALFAKSFKHPTTFGVEAAKYTIVENVEGGIYNSGNVKLHVFKGIDQAKDYIEVKPGEEYVLPKDFVTITVLNPSDSIDGEFQVKIKSA